ncbi:MAG: VRR-NUC domain-containing protein [Sphingomonas fennica]
MQRGAIDLLASHRIDAVHVPNGSHLAGGTVARAKQMAALLRDGLRPGFPDLIVFGRHTGQVGFLECKREGKTALHPVEDAEQVKWRARLEAAGFPWALVQLPEDAIAAVRSWGWL